MRAIHAGTTNGFDISRLSLVALTVGGASAASAIALGVAVEMPNGDAPHGIIAVKGHITAVVVAAAPIPPDADHGSCGGVGTLAASIPS